MVVTGRMNIKIIVIILLLIGIVTISTLTYSTYERFQINDLISTFPGTPEEVSKQPDNIDKPETSVSDLTSIFPGTPEEVSKPPEMRKKRPVKSRDALKSRDASLPNSYNNEISEINNKLDTYLPRYDYAFEKMNTKLEYLNQALTPPKIISNNPKLLNNPLPQETPITSEENPLREQTILPPENRIKPVSPLRMPRKRPVGIEAPPSEVFPEPVPVREQPDESPPPEQPVEAPLPEQPVEAPIVENFSNRRNNKYVDFTSKFNLTPLEYSPVF